MEFTAADIFQHSPFGDILSSLKYLSLSGEPWLDCGQDCWDTDDEEIQSPPTTHLVATVDDLTDMLDFDSKDIEVWTTMPEMTKNQQLLGTGKPPHHITYTWWISQRMGMAKEQRRMTPPRNSPSASVSGAALNPAIARMEIPAPEIITPQTVPKTTPSSKIQRRRTETPALIRKQQTKK